MTMGCMRLAHFSDLHLPIPAPPAAGSLMNKRILGYLSWTRTRRFRHRKEALEIMVADCRRRAPDFTAITGDLVNISHPDEISAAAQWLAGNFDPRASAFCPGNHDAYVAMPWAGGLGSFDAFMAGTRLHDETDRPPSGPDDFPFVRIVGGVGLVFANSSPPTLPGLASGKLGKAQISRIAAELESLGRAGRCRVLAIHHPVTEGAVPRRKALDDQADLRAALHDAGVELILHGHTHFPVWAELETRDGARPVAGVGSASHPAALKKYRPARYNLFEIGGNATDGWRIDVETRELDPAAGDVKTADRRTLLPT